MRLPSPVSSALLLAAATTAGAQQATPGAQRPPVRPLGQVVARGSATFGTVAAVRALPGGRLLVNDPSQRRVVLLDQGLGVSAVVADTTPATGNAYGGRLAGIIPYRGDSTLFVDAQTMSMLVIDPAGKIGRTMSVPRAQDAMALVAGAFGTPGFDPRGRLVYRAAPEFRFRGPAGGPGAGGAMQPPEMPDSAVVVRVDLATRVVDTVGWVRTPKISMQITQAGDGRFSMQSRMNPLPVVDDWVVLGDGTVAFVRGRDYRVEFVAPDGASRPSAKIAFDWQRLTDEQKVAFIDSVKAQRARLGAVAGAADMGGGPRIMMQIDGGPPGAGGGERRRERRVEGGENTIVTAGGPPAAGAPGLPQLSFVEPGELPDYRPAFFANATRVDGEGNLWIRTTANSGTPGALVYDVVSAQGALVDRVLVPAGRQIVGFGPGGDVYLTARDASAPGTPATTIERARVR